MSDKYFCFYSDTMASIQPYSVFYNIDGVITEITEAKDSFTPDAICDMPSDFKYLGRGEVVNRKIKPLLSIEQQLFKIAMDYILHD